MKFGIAGNGRAAHHFAKMLYDKGHVLTQVYGRTPNDLAANFNAEFISSPSLFSTENEVIFLAVSDDAIASVANEISEEQFVVHASGMTSIDIISHRRKGVAWPIQSLTKSKELKYDEIPFLIEGTNQETEGFLMDLFSSISKKTLRANSEQRSRVHIAAVFANNFTNHLFELSADFLHESGFDFDILLPMIHAHIEKLSVMTPHEAQTGPAVRMDRHTIEKQQALLKSNLALLEIYNTITNSILQKFHGKKL